MTDDLVARMGRNLREFRRKAGLDLDEVASRTGLQPATLSRYETGRERIPVEVLTQLARALGRPVEDFFA